MKHRITLEICCGGLEDAVNAERGGADRIELNAALFLGGLTPGVGLLRQVKARVRIPVVCMVRPREGGFCYSEADWSVMLAECEALLKNGADGLAFGVLHADGTVDVARAAEFLRRMRQIAPKAEAVFHRAFDVTPDRSAALETLIGLGVQRVLTSGGKPTAPKGTEALASLVRQSSGRIEILPGGGITPENAAALLRETGATALHASARREIEDPSTRNNPEIVFGGRIGDATLPEDRYKVTDPCRVVALRAAAEGR